MRLARVQLQVLAKLSICHVLFAKVAGWASWHDVLSRVAASLRCWDLVLTVKRYTSHATVDTSMVVGIKNGMPFGNSQRIRESRNTSPPTPLVVVVALWVSTTVITLILQYVLTIGRIPFLTIGASPQDAARRVLSLLIQSTHVYLLGLPSFALERGMVLKMGCIPVLHIAKVTDAFCIMRTFKLASWAGDSLSGRFPVFNAVTRLAKSTTAMLAFPSTFRTNYDTYVSAHCDASNHALIPCKYSTMMRCFQ